MRCTVRATGSWSALLAIFFASGLAPGLCQQKEQTIESPFAVKPNLYLSKWDPTHEVLLFYRDTNDPLMPAVRAYDHGTQARLAISPLKDFPDAKAIDIWDVAAATGGEVIMASVIQYGGQRVKHALLTYDHWGLLRKFWEVYPYHHHKVGVDPEGNVYAFGHREDRGEQGNEPDYSLLIKYSTTGKVLWKSLPRSTFPYDQEIVATSQGTGEHKLLVANDALLLYVATTGELFWFNLGNGKMLRRASVSQLLDQMASDSGMSHAEIVSLAVSSPGDLLAQVRVWRKDPQITSIGFVMARIAKDGSSCQRLSAVMPVPFPGLFLGSTLGGTHLFLGKQATGETVLLERRVL